MSFGDLEVIVIKVFNIFRRRGAYDVSALNSSSGAICYTLL
jgi:hypothetical protein